MSLFDIIKYGNIDLGSEQALDALPRKLLDAYWDEMRMSRSDHTSHSDKLYYLSGWFATKNNHKVLQLAYKTALEEYNNESL